MSRVLRTCSAVLSAAAILLGGGLGVIGSEAAAGAASGGGTPVKVAFICSCTGPLASSVQPIEPAFKAWVSATNAKGGVDGHKIDAIYKDDGSSPTTSTAEIQQLLSQNISSLIDNSAEDADWASTVEAAKVPIIASAVSLTALGSDDVFVPSQTLDSLPMAVALTAKKVGLKNYGLLYCAESPTCQQLVAIEKADAAKVGVGFVYSTAISASAPNYTAQCLAAKQAGSEGLFVGTAVQVAISVASDCVKQGYNPVFIGDDGAIGKNFNKLAGWGNDMVGVQPDIPWFVNNTSTTKAMYAAWKKYQPGILTSPNFNELAVEGWAQGLLLGTAVQGAQTSRSSPVTAADVINGMYTIHNNTLGGIAPALTFTRGQPHLTDCWFLMRTSHGHYTTPYGLRTFCLPPA